MNRSEVVNKIRAFNSKEQCKVDVARAVRSVVVKFDGKKITKRIATAVEKVLTPEHNVFLKDEYSMFTVMVRLPGETEWERFLIGYASDPFIRADKVIEYFISSIEITEKLIADGELCATMPIMIDDLISMHTKLTYLVNQYNIAMTELPHSLKSQFPKPE